MPNGSDAVVLDGGKPNTIGVTRSVGVSHEDMAKQVPTFENSAGTGLPEQRLREQDQDGVDAEILFSQISIVLRRARDDAFYLDLVRAYNEYLMEEYAAVAPDRLIPMGTIPMTGMDDAIKELERRAKLGFKGVDNLMWGTDFAHAASDWPNSRRIIEQDFGGVPEGEKHAMLVGNVV